MNQTASIAPHVRSSPLSLVMAVIGCGYLRSDRTAGRRSGSGFAGRRGFTIIEAVVVIAVIGVLAAFLLPAMWNTRFAAHEAISRSHMRSHYTAFGLYSSDYRGHLPAFTDPRREWSLINDGGEGLSIVYFEIVHVWHIPMWRAGYTTAFNSNAFQHPTRRLPDVFTPYYYTQTALADPDFWHYETRTGPEQWRATRRDEVLFPSSKGLLYDSSSYILRIRRRIARRGSNVAFFDGSVRDIGGGEFLPAYRHGTGTWHGSFNIGIGLVNHTIGGLHGRDVRD